MSGSVQAISVDTSPLNLIWPPSTLYSPPKPLQPEFPVRVPSSLKVMDAWLSAAAGVVAPSRPYAVSVQLPCRDFFCDVQAESKRLTNSRNSKTFFILSPMTVCTGDEMEIGYVPRLPGIRLPFRSRQEPSPMNCLPPWPTPAG